MTVPLAQLHGPQALRVLAQLIRRLRRALGVCLDFHHQVWGLLALAAGTLGQSVQWTVTGTVWQIWAI